MLDILIKNGTIIDGSGNPRYTADVAVEGGVITRIGKNIDEPAERVIDAAGLSVTPGFIDTHSHGDDMVLFQNDAYNCLEQGITTQLVGNCGESPAPYPEDNVMPPIRRQVSDEELAQIKAICRDSSTFMEHAKHVNLGVNVAFLIGHNAIRAHAMGTSDGKATPEQLEDMRRSIRIAMEAGFFGYSTGLVYAPSVYGDTEELTELAKVVADYGGVYASHIRGEGNSVFDAVAEAIEIGRGSGASVLVSHIKIMGEKNRGRAAEILKMLHSANEDGVHVFADQYPYEAGSAPLITQIPPKYLAGGKEETLRLIADREMREKIEYSIFHEADEFESSIYDAGYDGAIIVTANKTPQYVGMTLGEIAKKENKAPIDVMMDILIANDGVVQAIYKCQSLGDVLTFMADPLVHAGCDWFAYEKHFDINQRSGGHPRGTSTMIRRIELTRDNGLRSAEDCIRSITGAPAEAMGFTGRGLIKEGYAADICVLDYPNIRATSDYLYPFKRNQGLHYVLVNGNLAVCDGLCTGGYFGQPILHKSKKQ